MNKFILARGMSLAEAENIIGQNPWKFYLTRLLYLVLIFCGICLWIVLASRNLQYYESGPSFFWGIAGVVDLFVIGVLLFCMLIYMPSDFRGYRVLLEGLMSGRITPNYYLKGRLFGSCKLIIDTNAGIMYLDDKTYFLDKLTRVSWFSGSRRVTRDVTVSGHCLEFWFSGGEEPYVQVPFKGGHVETEAQKVLNILGFQHN